MVDRLDRIRVLILGLLLFLLTLSHSARGQGRLILQLGYFKSHHLFFVFTLSEVAEDARYSRRR